MTTESRFSRVSRRDRGDRCILRIVLGIPALRSIDAEPRTGCQRPLSFRDPSARVRRTRTSRIGRRQDREDPGDPRGLGSEIGRNERMRGSISRRRETEPGVGGIEAVSRGWQAISQLQRQRLSSWEYIDASGAHWPVYNIRAARDRCLYFGRLAPHPRAASIIEDRASRSFSSAGIQIDPLDVSPFAPLQSS